MTPLPEKFEENIRHQLGEDFPAFLTSLQEPVPVSIRLHPLKNNRTGDFQPVPWSEFGQYLPARPSFTLDPLFHAGSYYVQEASSMFLEQALKQCVDLNQPLNILDFCAAPGGKSTHILSLMHRQSLLVANEVIRSRAYVLSETIQKWGYPNAVVTNNDPADFQKLKGFFDLVVVDAPCSGEGLFRKDREAMEEWSPENVQLCCKRQKRILTDVWGTLKENGILIYSTCTYNPLENDDNMEWMRENYQAEFLQLAIDPSWGVEEVCKGKMTAYRFFPHRVKGEGLFLSVISKITPEEPIRLKTKGKVARPIKKIQERLDDWISHSRKVTFFQFNDLIFFTPAYKEKEIEFLLQHLKIVYAGTNMATVKHDKLVPDHALALSVEINRKCFLVADINEAEAISYLRREAIQLPGKPVGFTLLTYQSLPIGWVNILANRVNNMYPSEWRIRMSEKK